MTEKQTKQQLIEKSKEVQEDIDRLQKIVDASSETTFEIILEDCDHEKAIEAFKLIYQDSKKSADNSNNNNGESEPKSDS